MIFRRPSRILIRAGLSFSDRILNPQTDSAPGNYLFVFQGGLHFFEKSRVSNFVCLLLQVPVPTFKRHRHHPPTLNKHNTAAAASNSSLLLNLLLIPLKLIFLLYFLLPWSSFSRESRPEVASSEEERTAAQALTARLAASCRVRCRRRRTQLQQQKHRSSRSVEQRCLSN